MTKVPTISTLHIRRARGSRVLSYLLLFLISYSSSAEIFHHHGLGSEKITATSRWASVFSDTSENNSSTKAPLERNCLVCQFQRGLSSAAISAPVFVLASTDIQYYSASDPITHDSLFATSSRGRAPPITN
ncbi:MAG: hypothetical protein C5B55_09465 [Blastocatellia bacterium]|nr:MAG: hypothetical protein C5B55_09465 [Blastocatellia bacterium]